MDATPGAPVTLRAGLWLFFENRLDVVEPKKDCARIRVLGAALIEHEYGRRLAQVD